MTPEAACGPQGCRGFHDGYFGPQQSWGDLSAPMGCVSGMCYWRVTSAFFPYGCSVPAQPLASEDGVGAAFLLH